jgi:hypothetical protein
MIKRHNVKLGAKSYPMRIKPPDTFISFVEQNAVQTLDIHFGANYDVLIIVPSGKQLSKDNQERIRILTEVKQ